MSEQPIPLSSRLVDTGWRLKDSLLLGVMGGGPGDDEELEETDGGPGDTVRRRSTPNGFKT